MISAIGTPSACERSRTVTPDSTVTGPVGATGAVRARLARRPLVAVARLAGVLARARGLVVDDDAGACRPRRRRRAGGSGGSACSVR